MYDYIPNELKALRQWVCWDGLPDAARPGKIKKVPIDPNTHKNAQSNNPQTWSDYKTAVNSASNHSGIGFMFGNGYFGVDIDDAQEEIRLYRTGDTDNIISEFIHSLQTYAEYSVSGNGIHLICKGALPAGGRRKNCVEMYSEGRYFIMTGNAASEYAGIVDCTDAIKPLHEKYIGGGNVPAQDTTKTPVSLSDEEIIDAAKKSKQGAFFTQLYSGRWEGFFTSQSEADMSFCNMLAFWCRKDEAQMDRIYRSSGLMRDKWDRAQSGSTYGKLTIAKAVRDCRTVYTGVQNDDYAIIIGNSKKPEVKRHTFDDTGNAARVVDAYGEVIRYSYVAKKWLFYDGRRWLYDFEGATRRMVDDVINNRMAQERGLYDEDTADAFDKHLKATRASKAKSAMLTETQHQVPILPECLDTHTDLFNTPNGILNLRTGDLMPHDKDKYITKISHVEYTDRMDAPLWTSFLRTIFDGDDEMIAYIQRAVGYSMTGSTREQCVFFMYGDGRNGKSTFLDTIRAIMGDYATNVQPETIMVRSNQGGPSSDIARLKGARFVTSVEPSEGMRLNEGLIKQITGDDTMTAAAKYENEFEFRPELKLWIAMNHKPLIRGTDSGIWRRIHLIPFTVQIPDDQVDRNLKHKLRRELPAIMHWAVDGCLLWQRNGLKPPQKVLDAVNEYRSAMDVIGAFLAECCERGPGEEQASVLFKAYATWAKESNEYEMTSTKFGREMAKRFDKIKDRNGWSYVGIHLRQNYRPYSISFGQSL